MDMNQGESEHDYECLLEADEGANANASSAYVFLAGRDTSACRCLSDAPLTEMLNRQGDECNGQSPLAAFAMSLVNVDKHMKRDGSDNVHVRISSVEVNSECYVICYGSLLECQIWVLIIK